MVQRVTAGRITTVETYGESTVDAGYINQSVEEIGSFYLDQKPKASPVRISL